jgi:hypothetical protein
MAVERVLILGAAGRDFHCFNTHFRDNPHCKVVAFTATQVPGIEFLHGGGRRVLIGLPEELPQLLTGAAGTEIIP